MFSMYRFVSRWIDKIFTPEYHGPSVAQIARDMHIFNIPDVKKSDEQESKSL